MIKKSKNTETLSDKIAGILTTAPSTIDPEDDIYEETTAKVTSNLQDDSDEDATLSSFRKQTVELLEDVDHRYTGKKGTRKSLQEDDEWSTEDEGLSKEEVDDVSGASEEDGVSGTSEVEDVTGTSEVEDVSGSSEVDSDSDADGSDRENVESDAKSEDETNFKHISETNNKNQLKKGACVRNQLNLWETLLETRIQLQKCVISSNKLPQFNIFKQFTSEKEFKSNITKTTRSVTNVLDKLLNLQELLLKQFSETRSLLKVDKKKESVESDEEIESDDDVLSDTNLKKRKGGESDSEISELETKTPKKRRKIEEYEQEIENRHKKYSDYRNTIIQKWNDKTRINIQKNQNQNSILQHINFILADKPKLIKRTQLKRSDYSIIGKIKTPEPVAVETDPLKGDLKPPQEVDPEIFDDDDFYHQLLRELIEFKSAGVTDPVQMSRQWIQLQNLRSKMKRKIDTKATKGRKIRYAVHSKLVNFMASIDNSRWTAEAKNELYTSVFGKNKFNKT